MRIPGPADRPPQPSAEAVGATAPEWASRPRLGLFVVVTAAVLTLDVVTKVIVVARLQGEPPVRLLGGAIYLVLVRNSGAAFSLGTSMTWLLTLIALAVVVGIARFARRLRCASWAVALGLVLGGALGNLADRLFRSPGPMQGHVVDFISLFAPDGSVWPVFNAADSAICVGGALVVLLTLLGHHLEGGAGRRGRP